MSYGIFASFPDPREGQKAAGALLDHGVLKEDLVLVVHDSYLKNNPDFLKDSEQADKTVKSGITTTTSQDAGSGAAKGAGVGVVLGILGGLAALTLPGFGIVIGGGALATAVGAAIGTTAAGAVAGGMVGFLKDQGVPSDEATRYELDLTKGSALLSVQVPSGKVERAEMEDVLAKYGATNVRAYPTAITHGVNR